MSVQYCRECCDEMNHGGSFCSQECLDAEMSNLNHPERQKERDMFEKSFERPRDYFKLSHRQQWDIDKELGILDWKGRYLSKKDREKFKKHYL